MGCRFAGLYEQSLAMDDNDAEDLSPGPPHKAILRIDDRLFSGPTAVSLPATLTGVRPARHMLVWEGYFRAAELLVEEVEREPLQAIRLVYPIMFAYRHAVEVALKFIIDFYGDTEVPHRHGLKDVWSSARLIVNRNCQVDEEELTAFEAIVAELDDVDRTSTAFRYAWPRRPISEQEYEAVDYPLDREDVHLDLAVVRDTMRRVRDYLDELVFQLMNCGFDPRD